MSVYITIGYKKASWSGGSSRAFTEGTGYCTRTKNLSPIHPKPKNSVYDKAFRAGVISEGATLYCGRGCPRCERSSARRARREMQGYGDISHGSCCECSRVPMATSVHSEAKRGDEQRRTPIFAAEVVSRIAEDYSLVIENQRSCFIDEEGG